MGGQFSWPGFLIHLHYPDLGKTGRRPVWRPDRHVSRVDVDRARGRHIHRRGDPSRQPARAGVAGGRSSTPAPRHSAIRPGPPNVRMCRGLSMLGVRLPRPKSSSEGTLSRMPAAVKTSGSGLLPRWRRRVVLGVLACIVALLVGAGLWAIERGYVAPPGSVNCLASGVQPVPSFDDLVQKYHLDPYCARWQRGETWFD